MSAEFSTLEGLLGSAREHLQRGLHAESVGNLPTALHDYDAAIARLQPILVSLDSSHVLHSEVRRQLAVAWMNRGNVLQKFPPPSPAECHLLGDIPSEPVPVHVAHIFASHGDAPLLASELPRGFPSVDPSELDGAAVPARAKRGRECHLLSDISVSAASAVDAYERAIALLETLSTPTVPELRNHLGAAWLNRGHALIAANELSPALESLERAIAQLETLPLDANPFYRLNLTGAWTNRAHVELSTSPALARRSAAHALKLLHNVETQSSAFAEMSLRARRALVVALGSLMVAAESANESIDFLAAEASDTIDDGLALARTWERRGLSGLHPLTLRLFRLGAQFYRLYQPHFLAEFLSENIGDSAPFHNYPEFIRAADQALQTALANLQRPRHPVLGARPSEALLATVEALRATHAQLSARGRQTLAAREPHYPPRFLSSPRHPA